MGLLLYAAQNFKLINNRKRSSEVCKILIVNAAVLLSHASANVEVFVFWVTLWMDTLTDFVSQ